MDNKEMIDDESRKLLDLNKTNLKETYVLEDMQMEHDYLLS